MLLFLCSGFQIISVANPYKGAEYRTKDLYLYGRFEVRMKPANVEGMLSSFFTYFDGTPSDPWDVSKWNEVDLEILGRYDDNIQFNTITPGQTNHVSHFPMSTPPQLDYHIYAFEWTQQYVAWFVDGVEVLRQTGGHISTITRPQKIMMNVWYPLFPNWAGKLHPESLPAFAYYDWVSYYKFTPDSGNYGSGNNFTFSWKDNFDSWDTDRWEKASHTFYGNGCDFIHENAVFQDGKLILCLTDSTNIGYTDITPPTVLWARANTINKIMVVFSEKVNQTDAENVSNYFITTGGVSVNSAKLRSDLKSVDLNLDSLDLNSSYNLIIYPMKDKANVPNTSTVVVKSVIISQPLEFPIRINCAGNATLDYLQEAGWDENTEYGSTDGDEGIYSSGLQISGTEEDIIYQSEKYGSVGYKVRVPNGYYDVKLMFAENYFDNSGSRVFDIYLEHKRAIENLDIYNEVGKNAALLKEINNVRVDDGILDIQFAEKVDNSLINGIVITSQTTDLIDEKNNIPNDFKIEQNYPNPFNGETIINYSLSKSDNVKFQLYNVLGEKVFSEDLGFKSRGSHQFFLDTSSILNSPLSTGIYFYVFSISNRKVIRKLVLLN